ncbi:MAG: hypothetical protein ACJA14_000990 [Ilumatobacter sp.]|jgi:hypothetical protein
MLSHPFTQRLAKTPADTVSNPFAALLLIEAFISTPRQPQVIALLLDHERRGMTSLNVNNIRDPDSVLGVADSIATRRDQNERFGAVVLASVRPRGSDELDDVERWLTLDETFCSAGVDLIEWFVIGRSISCPRALLGEPPRWAA